MNNTNDVVRFARGLLNAEGDHTSDSYHSATHRARLMGRTQSSSPAKSRLDGFGEEYSFGDISGVIDGKWTVYVLLTFFTSLHSFMTFNTTLYIMRITYE